MAKIATHYGLGSPESYAHEFGLDEGNGLGYVKTCIWPARKTVGLEDRWVALTKRIAQLVEDDPECQRILLEEKNAPQDVKGAA